MSEPRYKVIGKTEPSVEHPGKTFITEVMVNSPEGVRLQFDQRGVQLVKADGTLEKVEGRGAFGDVSFVVRSKFVFSSNNLISLLIFRKEWAMLATMNALQSPLKRVQQLNSLSGFKEAPTLSKLLIETASQAKHEVYSALLWTLIFTRFGLIRATFY